MTQLSKYLTQFVSGGMMRDLILNLLLIPLGCFGGGSPKIPVATPAVEAQDKAVVDSRDSEHRRMQAAAGKTNFTSPSGVPGSALVQTKSLLGQ